MNTSQQGLTSQLEKRRVSIQKCRKIVIKLGTKVLLSHYLNADNGQFSRLIDDIAWYQRLGYQFAIVTSGAVGFGMNAMGMEQRPGDLKKIQALASVGQGLLMQKWNDQFSQRGLLIGQILLTYDVIENRNRFLHARDCLRSVINYGAIPIINENDSVAIDELKFGDNDTLSALASSLMDAELLVLFTDTNGLFTGNPHHCENAQRVPYLEKIDDSTLELIQDKQNELSLGGMKSKLMAARRSALGGAAVVITNGFKPDLRGILEGEDIGTYIRPDGKFQKKRKRWIFFNHKVKGGIIVDEGAEKALIHRARSLLPGGVLAVEGHFNEGAIVGIYNTSREMIGKGITYYSSQDIERIKGQRTDDINKEDVNRFYNEIIHRDNMIVSKEEDSA